MKIKLIPSSAALLALLSGSLQGAVIYTETFSVDPAPASNTGYAVSNYGWSGYNSGGTNLSSSTTDPFRVLVNAGNTDGILFVGSGPDNNNEEDVAISAAGTIDPTAYLSDLTISFTHNVSDDIGTNDSGSMGYRVLAQVGSEIYASNFIDRSGTATVNLLVSDSLWNLWTGETDLTNGFDIAGISGTPGNLAAGSLSNIGLLVVDGSDAGGGAGNDRLRVNDFTITATAIPEPSAALLGALGVLVLLRRRR